MFVPFSFLSIAHIAFWKCNMNTDLQHRRQNNAKQSNNSGWKRPPKVSKPNLLLKSGSAVRSDQVYESFVQFVLKNSKDRRCTTSPGSLSHWLTLQGEKAFPYIRSESPVSTYTHCVSPSHHAALQRACLLLPDDLSVSTGRLLLGSCKAVSTPSWTCQFP